MFRGAFAAPLANPFSQPGGFLPTDIAGLKLWLKADTGTFQDAAMTTPAAADGDVVGGWADQSGNANHATQATTANKPLLKLAIQYGKPVVRFDGTNDGLQIASLTLPTFTSLFVTAKFTTVKPLFIEHSASSNTYDGFYLYGTSDSMFNIRRTLQHYAIGVAGWMGALWCVVSAIYDGTHLVRKNQVAQSNGNVGGTARTNSDVTTALNIACRNLASLFGDGDIAELIIYDSALSAAKQQSVEGYLNTRWAVY